MFLINSLLSLQPNEGLRATTWEPTTGQAQKLCSRFSKMKGSVENECSRLHEMKGHGQNVALAEVKLGISESQNPKLCSRLSKTKVFEKYIALA